MRDSPAADASFAPPRAARVFAVCALLLACALLSQAGAQLKWLAGVGLHKQPGFWSVAALVGGAVFALLMLLQRRAPAPDSDAVGEQTSDAAAAQHAMPKRSQSQPQPLLAWFGPLEYAFYFLLYVYAVPRLGYLPATLIALPLLTWRLNYRSPRMLSCAVLFSVVVVVLFKSLLQVKIPGGAVYNLLPDAARNFMTLYF